MSKYPSGRQIILIGQDHMQRKLLEMRLTAGEVIIQRLRAFIYHTETSKSALESNLYFFF